MDPKHSKLRHQNETESQTQEHSLSAQQHQMKEFESVEELIRFDAQQVQVPPSVMQRVRQSAARQTPPRSWWRRFLRGS